MIRELTGATKVSITLEFAEKIEPVHPEETGDVETAKLPEISNNVESDKTDEENAEWLTIPEIKNKYHVGYLTARKIAKTCAYKVQNKKNTKGRNPIVYNVSQIQYKSSRSKVKQAEDNRIPDGYIPVSELAKIMGLSTGYMLQYISKNQLFKHVVRVKLKYYCDESAIRKYRFEQEKFADMHGGNIVHKYCC